MFAIEQAFAKCRDLHSIAQSHIVSKHTTSPIPVQIVKQDDAQFLMLEKRLIYFTGQAKFVLETVVFIDRAVLESAFFLALS